MILTIRNVFELDVMSALSEKFGFVFAKTIIQNIVYLVKPSVVCVVEILFVERLFFINLGGDDQCFRGFLASFATHVASPTYCRNFISSVFLHIYIIENN